MRPADSTIDVVDIRYSLAVKREIEQTFTRRDNKIAEAHEQIEEQKQLISQQKEEILQMQAEIERLKELLNNK